MPLPVPQIDSRSYRQLVDETLARVPIHTPEWTNFAPSDPGVTIVQLFAFLAEAMIYRANQIPARNRAKFLDLLGVPLRTAREARGLAAISNERGELRAETLPAGVELLAGEIPFRTQLGLDVLPVEARLMVKRPLLEPDPALEDYYRLLYASYGADFPDALDLYEAVEVDPARDTVDLSATVDQSLWIAILGRPDDRDAAASPAAGDAWWRVREALGGRTLSLGLAPVTAAQERSLLAGGRPAEPGDILSFEMPQVGADGLIGFDGSGAPAPGYRRLETHADFDLLAESGIVQIPLPPAEAIRSWSNLDPLESGVGDLPPALEDSGAGGRLITWLRLRATGAARVQLRWAGINATPIRQIEAVAAEPLADGAGTPDQTRRLARAPVLAGSIAVTSIGADGERRWSETDDLLAAGPEVAVPGTQGAGADVFAADHEAGTIRFGDGLAGRRPASGARLFASYLYSEGKEGNLPAGAIKGGPLLPAGFTATNPVATEGGADAESVADGERQVQRFVRNRDRLVTAEDFETIAWRAPGVEIGRIEVLPAWHPSLAPAAPGAAPGVVTLLAIPRRDPEHPAAPRADRPFLDALCRHLDPRRLVTTELVLRGAAYKGIWISVGIETLPGASVAETCEAVRRRLREVLSPIPLGAFADQQGPLYGDPPAPGARGWPLGVAVEAKVLLAEAARVRGVKSVSDLLLAGDSGGSVPKVGMSGIELPELLGISVVAGDPVDLGSLRGDAKTGSGNGSGPGSGRKRLPVPIVPDSC
jgi:hypothetical protein